jgi:hypothetical protein
MSPAIFRSASTQLVSTWSDWVSALRRAYSARPSAGPPTAGNDSSSWPTAVAEDSEQSQARRPGDVTLTTAIREWPTPMGVGAETTAQSRGERDNPTLMDAARGWPTPAASDVIGSGALRKDSDLETNHSVSLLHVAMRWPTATVSDGDFEATPRNGIKDNHNLSLPVAADLWATPKTPTGGPEARAARGSGGADLEAQAWATPTTRDHKDGADPSARTPTNALLGRQAPRTELAGPECSSGTPDSPRRLNPDFVEWLMGWPRGWTDFAPVATEWSRWSQRMRSELSRLS